MPGQLFEAAGVGAAIVAAMTAIVTAIVRYLFPTYAARCFVRWTVPWAQTSLIIIINMFISFEVLYTLHTTFQSKWM